MEIKYVRIANYELSELAEGLSVLIDLADDAYKRERRQFLQNALRILAQQDNQWELRPACLNYGQTSEDDC